MNIQKVINAYAIPENEREGSPIVGFYERATALDREDTDEAELRVARVLFMMIGGERIDIASWKSIRLYVKLSRMYASMIRGVNYRGEEKSSIDEFTTRFDELFNSQYEKYYTHRSFWLKLSIWLYEHSWIWRLIDRRNFENIILTEMNSFMDDELLKRGIYLSIHGPIDWNHILRRVWDETGNSIFW